MANRPAKKRTWKSRLKQSWNRFENEQTGRRFQSYYNKEHRGKGVKPKALLQIGIGLLLMIAGGIMLVIPGPGIPVLAAGAVLIARHVKPAAKALDWLDVHIRRAIKACLREWKQASVAVRGLLVAGVLAGVAFVASGAASIVF
jgi:hypothetical protein